jgi:hypothetical protein
VAIALSVAFDAPSLPGLTWQSISLSELMDARVKVFSPGT